MYKTASDFIKCLFSILKNPTLKPIMSWNEDGYSFTINDPEEFERTVLKHYFPELTLKGFKKLIKRYSFTKSIQGSTIVYHHPCFTKSKPFLLGKITCMTDFPSRKKTEPSEDMIYKIRVLESAHTRMEETVNGLERKYQKIIDFNKVMIKELNQYSIDRDFVRRGQILAIVAGVDKMI